MFQLHLSYIHRHSLSHLLSLLFYHPDLYLSMHFSDIPLLIPVQVPSWNLLSIPLKAYCYLKNLHHNVENHFYIYRKFLLTLYLILLYLKLPVVLLLILHIFQLNILNYGNQLFRHLQFHSFLYPMM